MPGTNTVKQSLALALIALADEKPFAKVGVSDICLKSGVSRKDFSACFNDKYELMNWIFIGDIMGMTSAGGDDDGWGLTNGTARYLAQKHGFYRWALHPDSRNRFIGFFRDALRMMIQKDVQQSVQPSDDAAFFTEFFTEAILSAMMRWADDPNAMEADKLLALVKRAFSGVARQA